MSPTFRSLHNHNYRLYLAGSVVSNVGTWMQRIAQDWLVLTLPGAGGSELGITTGLQFLPALLFSPYAGVVADRMSKRRLLQITQLGMALSALTLGAVALTGHAQIWMVYVLAFIFGVANAFDAPARQSFIGEMVGPDDLTNAVGLQSATFNGARMVGPALAGLMIGALGGGGVAAGWVIVLNGLSYFAVLFQLRRMDTRQLRIAKPAPRTPGMLLEGLRYVSSQPRMLMILVLLFFAGAFGMNFQITSALMATQVFGKGASEFGLLGSCLAVGSLAGALMAARRPRVRIRVIVLAAVGFGVVEIMAGLAPGYLTFAAIAPVIGFCTMTLLNACNATLQITADPRLRGRVIALYLSILLGSTPLGAPVIGWIGEVFGARWTLIVGGALTLVGVGVAVLVLRHATRRVERAGAAEAAPRTDGAVVKPAAVV